MNRISVTHTTAETFTEYMAAKRDRQDEIKDIGGYVGGYLANGRRKAVNVSHRQLITLDADSVITPVWDDFTLMYSNAAAVYSTHKHTPQNPRLRIVIPLDRQVFPDEYEAIARRIAGTLGIENFDITTFQPERLMYWPSTSREATYFFDYQDGPMLSADSILATYTDWKDTSEWPVSVKIDAILARSMKKQGDPLEKPGVIGAFCRTFTISEAITAFLNDVYEPCVIDSRYTFKEGSTSAGVITYDDRFAYSHHGTDPISGKLVNAFDMVRLHKFGLQDEDTEKNDSTKLPSYTAMVAFATQIAEVRMQIGTERLASATGDFANELMDDAEYSGTDMTDYEGGNTTPAPKEPENTDWLKLLDIDRKGNIQGTIHNVKLILKNDPMLKGRLALNEFEHREVALGRLPWRSITEFTHYLVDTDDSGLRHYMENKYNLVSASKIKDGIALAMMDASFHPLKDYFKGLHWDGTQRVDTFLIDYLGCEDTPYTRAITRKALVGAVARIYRPGTKFDNVVTIIGEQGEGKSELLFRLGNGYHSDSFTLSRNNDKYEQLQGVWLVEIGEMAGLNRSEVEEIKHFISKRIDRYRVAYGKRSENYPRQCIFFITTNDRKPLRDDTGGRRFWITETMAQAPTKSPFTMTPRDVDQIWAEALDMYRDGELLFLDKELEATAKDIQETHKVVDDRIGIVESYLDMKVPDNWDEMGLYDRKAYIQNDDEEMKARGTSLRSVISAAEVYLEVLGGNIKDMNSYTTKPVHSMLQNISGWKRTKGKRNFRWYGQQNAYERVEKEAFTPATPGKHPLK